MPKETFKDWKTGERTLFELRWAKQDDVDPARTVVYLPPQHADGVVEMIGNGGDTSEIDRLIAALKRAKRAMVGDTFVEHRTGGVTDDEMSDIDRE